jgi:MFS family permease
MRTRITGKNTIKRMNTDGHVRSSSRWAVLSVSFMTFLISAYALQVVAPILTQLQAVFGISYVSAGLLMSVAVLPGLFLALPAGLLIDKYGFKKIGFLAAIFVTIGSLIFVSTTFFVVALFGRVIQGIGMVLLSIGTPTVITQWFNDKEYGRAMGIFAIVAPLGSAISFLSAPFLAQTFGWQVPFYIGACTSAVFAVAFLLTIRTGPLRSIQTGPLLGIRHVISRELMEISLVWMLFGVIQAGFLTWVPSLLVTFKGLSLVEAGFLSSIFLVFAIVLVPIVGLASDSVGRHRLFLIGGGLGMAVGLNAMGFSSGVQLVLSFLVFGGSAAMVPPIILALTARASSPEYAGAAFGLTTIFQMVGTTVTAPLIGYIIETTQSDQVTYFFISCFALVSVVIALVMHSKKQEHNKF